MKKTLRFNRSQSAHLSFALGFGCACVEAERRMTYIALSNVVATTPANGTIDLSTEDLTLIEKALKTTLDQCPQGGITSAVVSDLMTFIQLETADTANGAGISSG